MFYWNKIQNNKLNMWYIKTKFVIFYYKSTYSSSFSSQNYVSKNASFFPQNFPFWAIPSHITMIQKQQELKIQTNNVPWLVPIQTPCSFKSCTHPTPLTLPPLLYFGFHPQNPCKIIENEMRVFCILLNIWLFYYSLCNLHLYNN